MTATIITMPRQTSETRLAAPRCEQDSVMVELRRARIRIAQLEASLTETMRDNLANYNRAREAERALEDATT